MTCRTLRSAFAVVLWTAAFLFAAASGGAAGGPRALFARERAASGGAAWRTVVALRTTGTITQGGAASPFTSLVDPRSGWSTQTTTVGSLVDVSGYDGLVWDFQGGPVMQQTLPGLVADNLTQAYIARDGWWNAADPAAMTPLGAQGPRDGVRVVPRGGSAVDVWFDRRSGLIARLVAHADTGPVTTTLDDYRTVGDVILPYRSDSIDATGAETLQVARTIVPLAQVAAHLFARPQPRSSGTISGAPPAIVPFVLSGRPGAIIVTIRAGGRSLPVMFDSGGANFFVPAGARRLALRGAGGLSVGGVGNASENAQIAAVPVLALGAAVLHDQHAILAPLPYAFIHQSRTVDAYGLVGAEFLGAFRTSFDFIGLRARFAPFTARAPQPAGAAVLPVLSDGQHAYVRATIDGASGLFLLDTGDSGDITVFRRFANARGLFRGAGLPYLSVGGVGGHLAYHRYRAKSFSLGGATLNAPPVTISDATAGSFASRSVAGNIGLRIIARYGITFDLRAQTVTLVPNARVHAPFLSDRTGMSLDQPSPATFAVLSVVPGSPAAQAGLVPGTIITAINGTSIARAHLGLDDVQPFTTGARPYTLTVRANGAAQTLMIRPRTLLPAPS
jgi:hypothetical protein